MHLINIYLEKNHLPAISLKMKSSKLSVLGEFWHSEALTQIVISEGSEIACRPESVLRKSCCGVGGVYDAEGYGLFRHISHRSSVVGPTFTDLASWLSEGVRLCMTYSIKNCLGMRRPWRTSASKAVTSVNVWAVILSQSRSLSLSSVVGAQLVGCCDPKIVSRLQLTIICA